MLRLDTTDMREHARKLGVASKELDRGLAQVAFAVGERGVRIAKSFRRGGTTATKTAVRTGRAVNAYGHREKRSGRGLTLDIGAIKPTDGGRVPLHVRMLEGVDRSGNRFDRMVIRAKRGKYLTFPIRRGGGRSAAGIVRWARVKQVIYRPRPSLTTVRAKTSVMLRKDTAKVFVRLVREATA